MYVMHFGVCSEWAVGNAWLDANNGAMLLATAFVLLAGSYLEWCMILRARYEVKLLQHHIVSAVV